MKVTINDLEGDTTEHFKVDRIAFTNSDTFGTPDIARRASGETIVLVNATGYSSIKISDG